MNQKEGPQFKFFNNYAILDNSAYNLNCFSSCQVGLVCSVRLWYFLVIFTYFCIVFKKIMELLSVISVSCD